MIEAKANLIELLTPRQGDESFEEKLSIFAERYRKVLDHGAVVSIPDNPLGNLHFTAMEVVEFLGLPFDPDRTLLHVTTFHRKADLDAFLDAAAGQGLKNLLVVSGDGGPRLPRLEPSEIGLPAKTVTSVELLSYIDRRHPGRFSCGVAFNQYEPRDQEMEKLRKKLEAGARFLITQPVIWREGAVADLESVGLPVWVGAWMSRRVDLLLACLGNRRPAIEGYDPAVNLAALKTEYRGFGIYFARLPFRKDWGPLLSR